MEALRAKRALLAADVSTVSTSARPPHLGPSPSVGRRRRLRGGATSPDECARLIIRSVHDGQHSERGSQSRPRFRPPPGLRLTRRAARSPLDPPRPLLLHRTLSRVRLHDRTPCCVQQTLPSVRSPSRHGRGAGLSRGHLDERHALQSAQGLAGHRHLERRRHDRVSWPTSGDRALLLRDTHTHFCRIAGHVFRYEHGASSASPVAAHAESPDRRVGDFLVLTKTLGSGAFSRVHLAFSTKVRPRSAPRSPLRCSHGSSPLTPSEAQTRSHSRNTRARKCSVGNTLAISSRWCSGKWKCSSRPRM